MSAFECKWHSNWKLSSAHVSSVDKLNLPFASRDNLWPRKWAMRSRKISARIEISSNKSARELNKKYREYCNENVKQRPRPWWRWSLLWTWSCSETFDEMDARGSWTICFFPFLSTWQVNNNKNNDKQKSICQKQIRLLDDYSTIIQRLTTRIRLAFFFRSGNQPNRV